MQCPKLTKPYSFDYLSPLLFLDAHVKAVKNTGLVNFCHWIEHFVATVVHLGLSAESNTNLKSHGYVIKKQLVRSLYLGSSDITNVIKI